MFWRFVFQCPLVLKLRAEVRRQKALLLMYHTKKKWQYYSWLILDPFGIIRYLPDFQYVFQSPINRLVELIRIINIKLLILSTFHRSTLKDCVSLKSPKKIGAGLFPLVCDLPFHITIDKPQYDTSFSCYSGVNDRFSSQWIKHWIHFT